MLWPRATNNQRRPRINQSILDQQVIYYGASQKKRYILLVSESDGTCRMEYIIRQSDLTGHKYFATFNTHKNHVIFKDACNFNQ